MKWIECNQRVNKIKFAMHKLKIGHHIECKLLFASKSWINSKKKHYLHKYIDGRYSMSARDKIDGKKELINWIKTTGEHIEYKLRYSPILFIYGTETHFNYQFKSFHLSWNFNVYTVRTPYKYTIWCKMQNGPFGCRCRILIGRMHKL